LEKSISEILAVPGDVFRSVEILTVLHNNSTEAPQMDAQINASIAEMEAQFSQKEFQTRL
jgi:hypothetical protein